MSERTRNARQAQQQALHFDLIRSGTCKRAPTACAESRRMIRSDRELRRFHLCTHQADAGCRASPPSRHPGRWPAATDTANRVARRPRRNLAIPATNGTSREPSPSTTCCRLRGGRNRDARPAPGASADPTRHRVVATPEAKSPLAPFGPRGGRSGARLTAPAMILQLEEFPRVESDPPHGVGA